MTEIRVSKQYINELGKTENNLESGPEKENQRFKKIKRTNSL